MPNIVELAGLKKVSDSALEAILKSLESSLDADIGGVSRRTIRRATEKRFGGRYIVRAHLNDDKHPWFRLAVFEPVLHFDPLLQEVPRARIDAEDSSQAVSAQRGAALEHYVLGR